MLGKQFSLASLLLLYFALAGIVVVELMTHLVPNTVKINSFNAVVTLMLISACSQMTDNEWKAFRCREWVNRGGSPQHAPGFLRKSGIGQCRTRTGELSITGECYYSKNKIAAEAKEICDSVLNNR